MSTHTQSRSVRQSARHETAGRSPHFETSRSPANRDVATADESQVLRYNRIANLEAVLSIREHRQRSARLIAFWSIVLMMGTLALAAVLEM